MKQQLHYIFLSVITNNIGNIPLYFSIVPTDVPPNFNTTVFMINYCFKSKYIDKIQVEYKVNLQMKNNTVNKKEIEKFSKIAEEWWNPDGKFKPLHKFNPIRISYIKDNIIKTFKIDNKEKPLKKVKILDIGCGGGLLSEPMNKLGADGIDASEKNINIAKLHAKKEQT